jgi:hypothetical protein
MKGTIDLEYSVIFHALGGLKVSRTGATSSDETKE